MDLDLDIVPIDFLYLFAVFSFLQVKFQFLILFLHFYRDPVKCVEYLLRQPAFASKMVWGPIKEFSNNGKRLYSEMHTGDWWWEEQVSATCNYKEIEGN